jgi:ABC-type glycerol-3-phosphate transport system permease component
MKSQGLGDHLFSILNIFILIAVSIATLFPFLIIIGTSITPPEEVMRNTNVLFNIPKNFTLESYKYILTPESPIVRAFGVTILRTVLGTGLSLGLTALTAYALSKSKKIPGMNAVIKLFFFTILFSGGMIPTYLVVNSLHLTNTIWSLVLPGAINVYYLIIMISFFRGFSEEIEESAKIDGCSDIRILLSVVLPLSMPAIASIGLFYAVGQWNAFFDAVIYITDRKLWPVQLLLREILLSSSVQELTVTNELAEATPPPTSLIAATILITTLPIICVYPFLQKYFVKGVMLGSLKG